MTGTARRPAILPRFRARCEPNADYRPLFQPSPDTREELPAWPSLARGRKALDGGRRHREDGAERTTPFLKNFLMPEAEHETVAGDWSASFRGGAHPGRRAAGWRGRAVAGRHGRGGHHPAQGLPDGGILPRA